MLQVGGRDFRLDPLFFHRELQCLVAFELKFEEFQPEHSGKFEFYLEALDRDVRIACIQFSGPRVGEYLAADELRLTPR